MKKLFLVSLLLVNTLPVHAEPVRLVSGDGSPLSAVCIAAVSSREAMFEKAAEFGIGPLDAMSLRCNDKPIGQFAARTRHQMQMALPMGSYRVNAGDATAITALCVAAATSQAEYLAVKERYFATEPMIETEVECNGMSLDSFARRYRAPELSVSQR
jgi:hypothetical protein